MKNSFKLLLKTSLLISLSLGIQAHADSTKARCDIYPKGSDKASASIACTFSQRQGFINIDRSDGIEHEFSPTDDNPGTYKDQKGKLVYRQSELGKGGLIFRMLEESVYVYWNPYPFWQDKAAGTSGFEQSYQLHDISFKLSCPNNASTNTLIIQPGGLDSANEPISIEIDGSITAAEVADLNNDGSPEIYVFVNSAGSGSYGSVVAYAVNKGKSLTPIYMAPLSDDPVNSVNYMGHDEYSIVEFMLIRRFPIYKDGDTNADPSGGTRQLQYHLVEGEAGWALEFDLALEY